MLLWQLLTVQANYKGQWTALFCTGDRQPTPPQLASEHIYQFPNSTGYDGQAYHYIAHDPLFRDGLARYVDTPRLRYRRILVPLTAYALALGRTELVDMAYIAVILASVFWGAYWICAFSLRAGLAAWWGCCFLLIPATLISIDRLTVDVAFAAICAGFVLFAIENSPRSIYAILVLAPLIRETGFLLIAACLIHPLWTRDIRRAVLFSTAAFPAIGWYLFVQLHTASYQGAWLSFVPLSGLIGRLLHPVQYQLGYLVNSVATILDYAALAGIATAILLGSRMAWRRFTGPIEFGIFLFALLAVFLALPDAWTDAYSFARSLSPLLLMLALRGAATRDWLGSLPMMLVVPRILLQFAPQVLGILRSLHASKS